MSKTMSKTTAIAAPAPSGEPDNTGLIDFKSLRPDSRQLRIIQANTEGEPIRETDLSKVKTPTAGGTKWTVPVNGNEETMDEITGLLVCIAKRGYLWPKEDPTEQRPVIVSNDLVTGYRVSDDLGTIDPKALEKYRTGDRTYDWVALANGPEFGFKTARGGAGKRAKEYRILAILRDGDVWPTLVTVGPGSLSAWSPFQKTLPSFHYEVVVGLSLKKETNGNGSPFSMLKPRVVGVISEEAGEVARRLYTEPLKRMFAEAPWTGTPTSIAASVEE
jgi:hypothetical protein